MACVHCGTWSTTWYGYLYHQVPIFGGQMFLLGPIELLVSLCVYFGKNKFPTRIDFWGSWPCGPRCDKQDEAVGTWVGDCLPRPSVSNWFRREHGTIRLRGDDVWVRYSLFLKEGTRIESFGVIENKLSCVVINSGVKFKNRIEA